MTAPAPGALEAALRAADRYEASHPLCSFEKKLAYAQSVYEHHLAGHDTAQPVPQPKPRNAKEMSYEEWQAARARLLRSR